MIRVASPLVDRGPLRIEMVLPAMEAAGMEAMTARLTRALVARGHDVGVTCIESGGVLADALRAEGFRVAVVPALGLRSILRAPLLETWLRTVAPDVVHVHSGAWLKAARAARRAGVPRVVLTVHGLIGDDCEPWYVPLLHRWAARYTDWVAPVSAPLHDYMVRRLNLDVAKLRVIPNSVNTDHFRPGPPTGALRERLRIASDRLVVGTVARLDPVKNHALLIDAFARARAVIPEATLVIIGDGPLRESLVSRARELGVEGDVHFYGVSTDVAALYRELDVFVLSSNAEGTSMSILEAMASGVCVVATSVGGTPDLLADGAGGVLVPPGQPDALLSALTGVLRDGARRRRLAEAGRARAEAQYSESDMIDAYEALYYGQARLSAGRATLPASGRCAE
jgi:glycosyltransferase involved in cell wall biosynthesis